MYRFYINKDLRVVNCDYFVLPQNICHHINVLRIKNNEYIILFNGDGYDYKTIIIKNSKNNIQAKIINNHINNNESNIKINLIQSFPLINKFEFILQKSTELGISNIYPIISEKSNYKISEQIFNSKIIRWQNIINYACEQCGRSIVPKIHELRSLQNILNKLPVADISIIFTPNQHQQKIDIKTNINNINILIGSEAGFSADEENKINLNKIIPCSLGPRILRTETASLAAIVYLQTKFGDLNNKLNI